MSEDSDLQTPKRAASEKTWEVEPDARWEPIPHVFVGGMKVATLSRQALIHIMLRESARLRPFNTARPRLIFDSNGHGLSLRASDSAFRDAVDQGDIIHADGGVIVAASRLLAAKPIADRSATTDMFIESLAPAAEADVSYFLLGGREEVNAACVARIQELAPGLRIVGRRNGYFCEAEEDSVVETINAAAPDVLWVGLGKPREQIFCVRNRHRLKVGWVVTCGGLYNFITGDYPRAPRWMQRSGLEWVHRMATNPRHLFWRYITTNPHALWLIFRYRSKDEAS